MKHACGYVVDPDEIVSLIRAIENLIDDPELRQQLVTNAKERARVDFDPIVSSQAFIQAMEAML
jgi:glycosyltransferase involved in cell wall biosynthesis